MRLRIAVVCAFVWAVSLQGQDLRQTPAAQAACGPQETRFSTEWVPGAAAAPEQGKALVYVIEIADPGDVACLGRCGALTKVGLNGQWVGATQGNSYLTAMVDPGAQHLCANVESHLKQASHLVALHGLEASAGKTYFFGIHTLTGPHGETTGLLLMPFDEDEGRMLVAGYPYSKSTKK